MTAWYSCMHWRNAVQENLVFFVWTCIYSKCAVVAVCFRLHIFIHMQFHLDVFQVCYSWLCCKGKYTCLLIIIPSVMFWGGSHLHYSAILVLLCSTWPKYLWHSTVSALFCLCCEINLLWFLTIPLCTCCLQFCHIISSSLVKVRSTFCIAIFAKDCRLAVLGDDLSQDDGILVCWLTTVCLYCRIFKENVLSWCEVVGWAFLCPVVIIISTTHAGNIHCNQKISNFLSHWLHLSLVDD